MTNLLFIKISLVVDRFFKKSFLYNSKTSECSLTEHKEASLTVIENVRILLSNTIFDSIQLIPTWDFPRLLCIWSVWPLHTLPYKMKSSFNFFSLRNRCFFFKPDYRKLGYFYEDWSRKKKWKRSRYKKGFFAVLDCNVSDGEKEI